MTFLQKTSVVLFGVVFCFLFVSFVQAENFVPTTCECRIKCDLNNTPPNPLSPGSAIKRVGSGLTTNGFLDIMNAGIGEACGNFFSISATESRRLYAREPIAEIASVFKKYFDGSLSVVFVTPDRLGREIDEEYVLGAGCAPAGELLSKTYSCRDETFAGTSCLCLPNDSGSGCFRANPEVDFSCERKNDRGLNQEEFAESVAAINGTPERTVTTCDCSLTWSGYAASMCQAKQWSFPYSERRARSSIFSELNINTLCPGYTTPWTPTGLSDTTVIESSTTCAGTAENINEVVDDGSGTSVPAFTGSVVCTETTIDVTTQREQNYGPGYEPIAWSFPTDKINALNKVGISGNGTTQVQLLIGRLIKYAVGFLGALALCLVIYSGLRFMLSQGEEDKQGEALKMMLWAGIGIVALLGSYSMVTFVLGVLK